MVSWVGIRGAAPIVLATFPLAAGVDNAALMFRLIFFMVILSVTLQGWLIMPVAKLLKVADDTKEAKEPPAPLELEVTEKSAHQEMKEYRVRAGNELIGKTLAEIKFPQGVLVTMIRRNKSFIPPHGDTRIEEKDGMLIMADIKLLKELEKKYFFPNNPGTAPEK